jgi:hypothetical protein
MVPAAMSGNGGQHLSKGEAHGTPCSHIEGVPALIDQGLTSHRELTSPTSQARVIGSSVDRQLDVDGCRMGRMDVH